MYKIRLSLLNNRKKKTILLLSFSLVCWAAYFLSPFFCFCFLLPTFYILEKKNSKIWWVILFIQFLLFNLITSFWLIKIDFFTGLLIHFSNGLLMFISSFLSWHFSKLIKINSAIAFISFWLFLEQLHNLWPLSWPWLSLGNIFGKSWFFNQWYDLFGELSGSIFILILNYCFYIFQTDKLRNKIKSVAFIVLMFTCAFSYSYYKIHTVNYPPFSSIKIKALLPNINYSHFGNSDKIIVDSIFLREKSTNENTLLVLPENCLMDNIWLGALNDSRIVNTISNYVRAEKCIGCLFGTIIKSDRKTPIGLLNHYDNRYKTYYSTFEASIFIDSFKNHQFHLKRKLIPKEEYLPHILNNTNLESSKLSPGNEYNNIKIKEGKIVNLICYEASYPEDVANCVKDSGGAIIMIANQQMFPYKFADEYYTNICRLRAIENKKYFLKVANKGATCLINPLGQIVAKADDKKFTIFKTQLPMIKNQTFYTKNASWIHWLFLLQPFLLFIFPIKRIIQRNKIVDSQNQ